MEKSISLVAATITDVVSLLDQIIANCILKASRTGYFAALYRKMTIGVQEGIGNGVFDDGSRMETLDVVFANRYLAAYNQFTNGEMPCKCWKTAFEAAVSDDLIVLQHLLLGMNAHINLDLAIAAAQISTPETIGSLYNDYLKINTIIAGFFKSVQSDLSKIAFPMRFIELVDPEQTNAVLNFSISKAREAAWANALLFCEAGNANETPLINTCDNVVDSVAQKILQPGAAASVLTNLVLRTEQKDVAQNIAFLNQD
ncbi:DUF5995 family protein [Niabella ginsenosidivorans]|uniref:DUF5995 family protein n=1 Tax=Niabella ginsenosidivorans TaxID=1176587 RepID=UPI000A02A604|nr:DUF5995 family protein [Niabella ginsenosidivorans]